MSKNWVSSGVKNLNDIEEISALQCHTVIEMHASAIIPFTHLYTHGLSLTSDIENLFSVMNICHA